MYRFSKKGVNAFVAKFSKSKWLFPTLLTIVLVLLTILRISGTSIGIYHEYFYGKTNDSSLLANKPRQIRSDEWLVNTQMIRAQSMSNYKETNYAIGNGQDMSLILDVPYKSWSMIFKPLNFVFLALPFNIAFALKWWLMGYLLVLSCYFLILELMPKKIFFAAFFSMSLFFMPFIQWWYQYITIAPFFLALLIALTYIKLLRVSGLKMFAWGALLAYLVACYAFVFYPPFQIACAIPLGFFLLGKTIERYTELSIKGLVKNIGVAFASVFSAGFITLLYLKTKSDLISIIQNTAYPGKRSVAGGGYDLLHVASNHLAAAFQFTSRANKYVIASKGILNQSETANFILLIPYLVVPVLYSQIKDLRKNKKIDWPLLMLSAGFFLIVIRLFVPYFNQFFRIIQLDKVPHNRLLIGLGLLSTLMIIMLVRYLDKRKAQILSHNATIAYTVVVFIACGYAGYKTNLRFPGFTNILFVAIYSALIAAAVYLILSKRLKLFSLVFFFVTLSTTIAVHPFYVGTGVATSNQLSNSIRDISNNDPEALWISEDLLLENFTAMNGAPSLSGTFAYPQLELWNKINNVNESDFNRYAHVNFNIDSDIHTSVPTELKLMGPDNFKINIEPCSEFLKSSGVGYIVTAKTITDTCTTLKQKTDFPVKTIYIYQLNH
jgi:hypothetical protein